MRVYGSSPLYNYVELVFRSKRLFLASIILATVVTVAVATVRAHSYTATAVILLSGSKQTGPQVVDENQLGSVKYKLNLLNVVLKDPNFMKEAFRNKAMNQGLTEVEFDRLCKDVRTAMSYAAGENVLEISMRWPDARAANFIEAFVELFRDRVKDQETVFSRNQKKLYEQLLDEYTQRVKEIDARVVAYQKQHVEAPLTDWNNASVAYEGQLRTVRELENQLEMERLSLGVIQKQLTATPVTITEMRERQAPAESSEYRDLMTKRQAWEQHLAELRVTKTELYPEVKRAREVLEQIDGEIKRFHEKKPPNIGKVGPVVKEREIPSPEYTRLSTEKAEREIRIKGLEGQLRNARAALASARGKAASTPQEQYDYKWLRDKQELYTKIRENIAARLEQASMDLKRDQELHLAEITMMVQPVSEPDIVGVRSLIFYAAGPLLGLLIAFAFSLLAESMDHSLRTPVEVEKYLGKPVLAVLPRMDPGKKAQRQRVGDGGNERPSLPSG